MIKLLAVGDIFLKTKNNQNPFEDVKKVFKEKDILFGNLETVLSEKGKKAEKFALISTSPDKVKFLNELNFDVLNLANNHILDRDFDGLKDTINTLNHNCLNYIGINKNNENQKLLIERNGIKFGFIGYAEGESYSRKDISISKIDEDKILADIEVLKNKCDLIVVSLHWGIENVFYPSPEQITLSHKIIDGGATLILGHHPHIIQGLEKYKNGLIIYSLGNFNFDQKLSKSKTNKSIILSVNLSKIGIVDYETIPIEINENFIPNLIEGDNKQEILDILSCISKPITENKITENWWFEQIGKEYLTSNWDSFMKRIKNYGIKHLIALIYWLISPFCIKCYFGILRSTIKKL